MLGRVNTVAKCPGGDRDSNSLLFFLAALFRFSDELPQRLFEEIRILRETAKLQESVRYLLVCRCIDAGGFFRRWRCYCCGGYLNFYASFSPGQFT